MSEGYVVAVKPSARRVNAAAGEWIAERGSTRRFDSKDEARRWAASIVDLGAVRVQDAAPNDPASVDGYLVADPARGRGEGAPSAESATLDRF